MEEMTARGYKVSPEWWEPTYRGKTCPAYSELKSRLEHPIYPEYHAGYLKECLDNLAEKGSNYSRKNEPDQVRFLREKPSKCFGGY